MNWSNHKGWIVFEDLGIPADGGCQIQYLDNELGRWFPACIFPSLDEQVLFARSNYQAWARGTTFEGTVMRSLMTDDKLYWNYFITFKGGDIPDRAQVRITTFEGTGASPRDLEAEVRIDAADVVFLNDWAQWRGAEIKDVAFERFEDSRIDEAVDGEGGRSGWTVDCHVEGERYLTNYGLVESPPLYYNPGLTGEYELYLCFKQKLLEMKIELPGMKHLEKVRVHERIIAAYKWWKEIYVGKYRFEPGDEIGIHKTAACSINKLHVFGDLFYIKLVPAERRRVQRKRATNPDIIFYSEPESLAYLGELRDESMLADLVEEYSGLKVDKIICQLGRGGSQTLHPSKVVKPAREGPVRGDDLQESTGVLEARNAMNVMDCLPSLCRKKGIQFIANIGINVCYRGSNHESEFSARNPGYHHPRFSEFLDFDIPEVRDYVASMLAELAEYEVDGLSVDHTRCCYGQTANTVCEFHRLLCAKIGPRQRNQLEINIRMPASSPVYYRALEVLLEEDLIDTFIPSNQASIYPEIALTDYVKLAKQYGKGVYGCLDAWAGHESEPFLIPRPADYVRIVEDYRNAGVAGLFFYQSEQILENVFLRRMVKQLKA